MSGIIKDALAMQEKVCVFNATTVEQADACYAAQGTWEPTPELIRQVHALIGELQQAAGTCNDFADQLQEWLKNNVEEAGRGPKP